MSKHARFFKQLASIAAAAVLAACLTACGTTQDAADGVDLPKPAENGKVEVSVEAQTYPCVKDYIKADGPSEGELSIAFVEGGDIPYVALSEYMPFLSDALAGAGFEGVEYTVERVEDGGHIYAVSRSDNQSILTVNTETDFMSFVDFNTFMQKPGVTALVTIADLPDPQEIDDSAMFEEMEAAKTDEEKAEVVQKYERMGNLENGLIQASAESFNRSGGYTDLYCGEYNIDIVEHDGECYVPFQTLTDLFMGNIYVNCVFNGERLFALKYGSELTDETAGAQPAEMSERFAAFNFNELRFLLDNFYGLKSEHDITKFIDFFFANEDLITPLLGTDSAQFDAALARFLQVSLDDGHSALGDVSWRTKAADDFDDGKFLEITLQFGPSNHSLSSGGEGFKKAREKAFPDGVPMYQEVGDTAFITFDSFVSEDELADYYDPKRTYDPAKFVIKGDEDEDSPVDTVDLIRYANEQINRKGSPVKNVVVDLSNNGGGNSDAAVFTISWLLGSADVALKDTFTGAQTFMSCTSDTNLNNLYGEGGDTLIQKDIDVYCLISPSSFSCGNLVPAALKLSHRATLLGQTSGGGSCVVLPCTTASGTFFQISGSKQLALPKNGSFYNIDNGIEPDVVLTKEESYYDREALVAYLHELK